MTLLEVIFSLALMGMTVAMISEMARTSFHNARMAKDIVQAELLAESILAKIRLGIIDLEPAFDVPVGSAYTNQADMVLDTHARSQGNTSIVLWHYSVEITNVSDHYFDGLLDDYLVEVAVTVRQNEEDHRRGVACRLVRWIAIEPEIDEEEY